MRLEDLTNKTYGKLTVLGRDLEDRRRPIRWVCRCDCGAVKSICGQNLREGQTRSCGCSTGQFITKANTTHGLSNTPEYLIWRGMLNRCYNPKADNYNNYGGRGIKVCDKWKHSFEAFIHDMGFRPTPHHQIDRIDNDKGYAPKNCKWSTREEQARNKQSTLYYYIGGEKLCLAEIAERYNLPYGMLACRIHNSGMTVEEAVSNRHRLKSIEYNGETKTLKDWSRILSIPYKVLHNRIHKLAWDVERAFKSPVDKRYSTVKKTTKPVDYNPPY